MIIVLNVITSLALLLSLSFLLYRLIQNRKTSTFILIIAFGFLFISSIFNFPEHLNHTSYYDQIEVIFDVLFFPTLILAIHITIIDRELSKRKISERRFKVMFNKAFSLVGLLDKDGCIVEANESALNMLDLSNKEVIGLHASESPWWSHSDVEQIRLTEALDEAAQSKSVVRYETHHMDSGGEKRYVDFSVTPIFSGAEKLINFIVEGRDITPLKLARNELELHKKNLEQLIREKTERLESANKDLKSANDELSYKNKVIFEQNQKLKSALDHLKETQSQLVEVEKMASLGTLTAGVAHEINNPLNYILGAYQALDEHLEDEILNKEEIFLLLDSIKTGGDRIASIVNSLNEFDRNTDNFDEECNIHEILNNCILMVSNQVGDNSSIEVRYESENPLIKGNVGKLHQAFINILQNATYAISDRGVIALHTFKKDDQLIIEIKDSGKGIPEELMNKITEPFFTTKPAGEGTGLGLTISYRIIQDHKGRLEFESSAEEGTKVTISFPLD